MTGIGGPARGNPEFQNSLLKEILACFRGIFNHKILGVGNLTVDKFLIKKTDRKTISIIFLSVSFYPHINENGINDKLKFTAVKSKFLPRFIVFMEIGY